MTYAEACKRASGRVALVNDPDELLAIACRTLSQVHAVNPGMLYDGAKKLRIGSRELMRMAHEKPGEFAFVQFA